MHYQILCSQVVDFLCSCNDILEKSEDLCFKPRSCSVALRLNFLISDYVGMVDSFGGSLAL